MTPTPQRLQLCRTRGFRLQAASLARNRRPAASVARPTLFGNPFVPGPHPGRPGDTIDLAACIRLYRAGIVAGLRAWDGPEGSLFSAELAAVYDAWEAAAPHLQAVKIGLELPRLRGLNLACWCALDHPCHADELLEIAND